MAYPTQFYEKVSEVEALSRHDHLNGQNFYQVPQEALSRNAREYQFPRGEQCRKRCYYSDIAKRNICEKYCHNGTGRIERHDNGCKSKCYYSHYAGRTLCDFWCPKGVDPSTVHALLDRN